MLELSSTKGDVQFRVKVVPGASRSRIVGELGGALKVAVSAQPEKGKANKAVVALLAKALRIKPAAVRIESGAASHFKYCRVTGMQIEQVRQCLERAYEP
ncbi:MAG: DUF167 domain-containing protein [Phycisphaerales bacterium]|nr:MAG: DUF167 domain-containing protein [Phycisphaerales bacterium]